MTEQVVTLDAGDLVWMDLEPARGREQAGAQPALVLSSADYHQVSALALVCPITRNTRPWPFKVMLSPEEPVEGAVLVDQVRALGRAGRGFRWIGRISDGALWEVRMVLAATVGLPPPP